MSLRDFAREDIRQTELRRFRVNRFILFPKHWAAYKPPTGARMKWRGVPFSSAHLSKVPKDKCGIYTFVAQPAIASHPACNYVLYVGKVDDSNFRTRFTSYLNEKGKTKPRDHILYMQTRWPDHLWFYFCPLDRTTVNITKAEDALITAFLPPVNRAWPATIRRTMNLVFA